MAAKRANRSSMNRQRRGTASGRSNRSMNAGNASGRRRQQERYNDAAYDEYLYGAAVPVYEEEEREHRRVKPRLHQQPPRGESRRYGTHMKASYVFSMAIIMTALCAILIYYISLQSSLTQSVQDISTLQSQLSELRIANDEAYNEIDNSIDLDEIKYKAITELGMKYANEDQIVTYNNDSGDYVHQVTEVK